MSVDIRWIVPWTNGSHTCKICHSHGLITTFEVTLYISKERYYYSETCHDCTRSLIVRDPVMMTYEYWHNPKNQRNFNTFWEFGLISPQWLKDHNIDKPI